jgi:tetratricopeptide (TPR) repeat protein
MDWERDPPSPTDSTKLNLDANVHEGVRNEEGRGEPIPSLQMDVANLETDRWPFDRWANVDVLGSPKLTRLFENLKLESNSLDESSFESFSLPDLVLLPATEPVKKYIPSSELNLLRGDICLEATICLEETPWYQQSDRRKGKESKLMPFKYPADVWFPSGHFVPGWPSPLQEIYPFPGAPSSSTRGKKSTKQLIVTYQQYEVDFNHKLSQLKRVCDDTQPGVIETMDDLAYVYYAQNKLIQAEYWYRKVITIRQQRNEDDSLSILYPQAMLAGVLCWLGRLKEANKMHQKTHSVIIRKLAPNNRLRKESFVVLARIAKELGKYKEAEAIFRQLVQINLASFGPKHPETLDCISELAETIRKQNRYVESQKLQGIVVQLLLESRENSPAKLCLGMVYLGIALSCQMRLKEATSVFRLSLDTCNESLGDKHPVTMSCCLRLGSALRKQKHVRESEEILRATLRRSIGTLGDGHMLTSAVMYELGKTLELCGRHGEATGWLEKSFRRTLEIWGPETKDALLGCDSLGWLYEKQGRYSEALALYEEFLDKVKNVGIDDNLAVASLSKWIASVRRKLREHGEDSEHGEISFS